MILFKTRQAQVPKFVLPGWQLQKPCIYGISLSLPETGQRDTGMPLPDLATGFEPQAALINTSMHAVDALSLPCPEVVDASISTPQNKERGTAIDGNPRECVAFLENKYNVAGQSKYSMTVSFLAVILTILDLQSALSRALLTPSSNMPVG
jgi:hypothetical protein